MLKNKFYIVKTLSADKQKICRGTGITISIFDSVQRNAKTDSSLELVESMKSNNKHMTTQQKGRILEIDIAKSLRDAGLDAHSTRTARSGAIYGLESDVKTQLPISIECKAQEATKFSAWYAQACNEVNKSKMPVVVWRPEGGEPFAFLKWHDLTEIMVYAIRGGWTERLAFPKPVRNKRRQYAK